MSSVWDSSIHKGSNLLTLLAIADTANDDGFCWPGIDHIAAKTRVSRSTVMRCIAKIEQSGELFVKHSRRHGNRYLVLIGKSDQDTIIAMKMHFSMSAAKCQEAVEKINEDRIKYQDDTNEKSTPYVAPMQHQKLHSYATSEVSPVQHDPSLTVKETSSIGDATAPQPKSNGKKPKRNNTIMNAIKDAIVSEFKWDKDTMNKSEWGKVQAAARDLYDSRVLPNEVPTLYTYCKSQYDNFGPNALATNVSKWRATLPKAQPATVTTESAKARELLLGGDND
jgi:hypothetical protein